VAGGARHPPHEGYAVYGLLLGRPPGGGDAEAATLAELPYGLRTEALKQLHLSAFTTIPMFKHCVKDNSFWLRLLENAEVRKYLPGDVIVRRGARLTALYVLKSGEVHDINEIGSMMRIRRRPSTWGEHFWFQVLQGEVKRARVEVRAASGAEVWELSLGLLRGLLKRDGYMEGLVRKYVEEQGAIAASEKFRRMWMGLRALRARDTKKAYKDKRASANQRPGAAGMLR